MAFCSNCFKEIPDGMAFCEHCGAFQAPAAQPVPQQAPVAQPVPQQAPVAQPYQAAPQQPYQAAPQQPYQAAPQQPYQAAPQQPYQAAPQQPYQAAPQQPYQAAPQQPYQAAPQQPYQAAPQVATAKKSMPKWVIPVAIVVLLGIVASILYFTTDLFSGDTGAIEDRIEDFAQAMTDGDFNALVNCFDPGSRASVDSQLRNQRVNFQGTYYDFPTILPMLSSMGLTYSVDVKDVDVDGDTAVAEVTFTISAQGQTRDQSSTIPCVKEDGEWYLDGSKAGSLPIG